MWRKGSPCALLVQCINKLVLCYYRKEYGGSQKTKCRTTIWPSNSIPGNIHRKKKTNLKRSVHQKVYSRTIHNSWVTGATQCPSIKDRMKKINTHTVKYYLVIEQNEIVPFAEIWIDLGNIMLGEISQTERDKYSIISSYVESKNKWIKLMCIANQKQTHRYKEQTGGYRGDEARAEGKIGIWGYEIQITM